MTKPRKVRLPPPPTLASTIVEELHYCCVAGFFANVQAPCSLIALRTGCLAPCVRKHKARWKAGKWVCEGKAGCLCAAAQKAQASVGNEL